MATTNFNYLSAFLTEANRPKSDAPRRSSFVDPEEARKAIIKLLERKGAMPFDEIAEQQDMTRRELDLLINTLRDKGMVTVRDGHGSQIIDLAPAARNFLNFFDLR